jgi:hypothetical protein
MKATETQKTQPRTSKSVFIFHRHKIKRHGYRTFGENDEAREIGKAMARKVAKKLKLHLDI